MSGRAGSLFSCALYLGQLSSDGSHCRQDRSWQVPCIDKTTPPVFKRRSSLLRRTEQLDGLPASILLSLVPSPWQPSVEHRPTATRWRAVPLLPLMLRFRHSAGLYPVLIRTDLVQCLGRWQFDYITICIRVIWSFDWLDFIEIAIESIAELHG
jgi:hypothetical protein